MNFFKYIRDRHSRTIRTSAEDASLAPLGMTYAEHKPYCRAYPPERCPYLRREIKRDEMDILPWDVPTVSETNYSYRRRRYRQLLDKIAKGEEVDAEKLETARELLEAADPNLKAIFTKKELAERQERIMSFVSSQINKPSVFIQEAGRTQVEDAELPMFGIKSQFYVPECLTIAECHDIMKGFCDRYRGRAFFSADGTMIDIRRERGKISFNSEYSWSRQTNYILAQMPDCGIAKMRIMTLLPALIQNSRFGWREKADHENNKDMKANGVSFYETAFSLENKDGTISSYSADLAVAEHLNGRHYLYDVVNIRPFGTKRWDKFAHHAEKHAGDTTTDAALARWLDS